MYKLSNTDSIIRLEDSALIPVDESNKDYRAYQEWVADGNEPESADEVALDFDTAISEQLSKLPLEVRVPYYTVCAAYKMALQSRDLEAASAIVNEAPSFEALPKKTINLITKLKDLMLEQVTAYAS